MNVDVTTSLKGQYTIYDENMNVLSESDNLITDWGMRRFVGDRSVGSPSDQPQNSDDSILAFCNNISQIFLGTGSSTPIEANWKLDSIIPSSEYTVSVHRSTTGTTLSSAPNDQLAIIFTNVQRFAFKSTLAAPSYTVRELGCSWTPTMSANNRYGIFSRAIIPATPVITVTPNSIIYVKYKLTIITDCNQVKGTMDHVTKGNAAVFPNNRTNVRRLPLYTLNNDCTPSGRLNENSSSTSSEFVQPLFEDMQLWNFDYVGKAGSPSASSNFQDNTLGTRVSGSQAYKIWWMQFYRSSLLTTGSLSATNGGAYPLQRFTTFVSTTTAVRGNSNSIAVDSRQGNYGSDYSSVIDENLRLFPNIGRKPADSCTISKIDTNQWLRSIKFVFAPQEIGSNVTVFKLYPATLGNWDNTIGYIWPNSQFGVIYIDLTGVHDYGVVTVLDATYTPTPDHFVGFEYQFAFKRN